MDYSTNRDHAIGQNSASPLHKISANEPPLRRALDLLRRQVVNTEQNFEALRIRLDPALYVTPGSLAGTPAAPREQIGGSPLVQEFMSLTERLEAINDGALAVLNRLEI